MKQVILVFILSLFCVCGANAQDVIVKHDNAIIESTVLEVGIVEVKYKKSSNIDGPTYTILKSEIKEIRFKNGEVESFNDNSKNLRVGEDVTRKVIFIKTTEDSKVIPTAAVWNREFQEYSMFKITNEISEADLIFEFRIRKAMGEARIKVKVFESKTNKLLWESKKYRGTANVWNKMGASLHGMRRCITKGIIPASDKGKF